MHAIVVSTQLWPGAFIKGGRRENRALESQVDSKGEKSHSRWICGIVRPCCMWMSAKGLGVCTTPTCMHAHSLAFHTPAALQLISLGEESLEHAPLQIHPALQPPRWIQFVSFGCCMRERGWHTGAVFGLCQQRFIFTAAASELFSGAVMSADL